MPTPEQLSSAKASAACCFLEQSWLYVQDRIHGGKCGDALLRKARFFEDLGERLCDPCIDSDEQDRIIALLNCNCHYGGCSHAEVPDCALDADFFVLDAIDQDDLPVSPAVDDAYYLLDGANVRQIATWDGSEWVFTVVTDGSLVLATDTNVFYVNIGAGPGPLFPRPQLTNIATDPLSTWYLTLMDPQTAQGRDIQLQGLGPNGWYNIDIPRNESDLPSGVINLTGLVFTAIRLKYTLADGCIYYSQNGSTVPPIIPPTDCTIIPDYTVEAPADASDQGGTGDGIFWIIMDQFDSGNEWASHVGEIVTVVGTTYTYTPVVPVGGIVYANSGSVYWWMTSAGAAPLFTPLTMTYGVGQVTVTSNWPAQSAVGTRYLLVIDDNGTIVWGGIENQLPGVVPTTSVFTEPVTATYIYPNNCSYDVPVTVEDPEPVTVSIECDEDNLFQYRYTDAQPQQILISAPPGQTLYISFAQGEMDPDSTIFIYDGSSDTDPILASGNYANLGMPTPLQVTSTGQYILIDIFPTIEMPDDLLTWQFQASCVTTSYIASPIITDDCDTYQFNVSAQVDFGGAGTYSFEVYVNGSSTPITFGPYSGEATYDLGDYPIGATVSVIMRNDADPTDYLWLGDLVTNGDCPDDPCAPIPDFIVRVEDCPFFSGSGAAYPGILFLATGIQAQCPNGITIGGIYMWDDGTAAWVEQNIPVGSVILGDDGTYYIEVSAGVVIPYFQLTIAAPTGGSPNNWTFWMPAIQQFGITSNRPVAIQTSIDGISWVTVWTGTEQQLATQGSTQVTITQTMNQIRTLWFYDTCGYIGPVTILS